MVVVGLENWERLPGLLELVVGLELKSECTETEDEVAEGMEGRGLCWRCTSKKDSELPT